VKELLDVVARVYGYQRPYPALVGTGSGLETVRLASAFGDPHPRSFPKVIVPSAASETRSPLLPSNLYFILVPFSFAVSL
jgi:hypothetical protein